MARPGAKLVLVGALLAITGFGLMQVGIRKGNCTDCDEKPEETIADVAQASAEIEEEK